jgi:hypothetical protein
VISLTPFAFSRGSRLNADASGSNSIHDRSHNYPVELVLEVEEPAPGASTVVYQRSRWYLQVAGEGPLHALSYTTKISSTDFVQSI